MANPVVRNANAGGSLGGPVLEALHALTNRLKKLEALAPIIVDQKDTKIVPLLPNSLHDKLTKSAMRGGIIRVQIPNAEITMTSAANTAYTTVASLFPLNQTEAKTFASVYDAARTVSFRWYAAPSLVVTASGVPQNTQTTTHTACAYDPANSGTYSSVTGVLAAASHIGPYAMAAIPFNCQQPTIKWKTVKIPKPVVDPGLVTDLLDSNWVGSSDTSVLVGYLKPYFEAAGAATSAQMVHFVIYTMEFCNRS